MSQNSASRLGGESAARPHGRPRGAQLVAGALLLTLAAVGWVAAGWWGLAALTMVTVGVHVARRPRVPGVDLSQLATHTKNSVLVTDDGARILWANPAFTRLTGVPGGEALGRTPQALLWPAPPRSDDGAARAAVEDALRGRRPFCEKVVSRSQAGRVFSARYDGQPLSPSGWMWVVADVDAEELARRRLESRARILEAMSARRPLGEVLGEVLAAVRGATNGLQPFVVLIDRHSLRVAKVVGPLDEAFAAALVGLAVDAGAPTFVRPGFSGQREQTRDLPGESAAKPFAEQLAAHRFVSCWSLPAFDPRREVVACLAAASDLARDPTADELALMADATDLLGLALEQHAVERENRTLRCAIQAADDAVMMVGEGRVRFANEVFARAFTGQVVGGSFSAFSVAHLATGTEALVAAVGSCSAWRGRVGAGQRGAEAQAWFDVSVTPVADGEASHEGVLVTFRDITPQVRDEHLQALSVEGEKAKAAVAWAMSVDAPLAERCSAALASVFQMQGLDGECRGAVYVREGAELKLLSYCGDLSDGLVQGAHVRPGEGLAGQAAESARLLVADGCLHGEGCGEPRLCETKTPHGHYVVPLLERPDFALGVLVLSAGPTPIRDLPRLEALTMIAELFATAVLRDRAERSLIASSQQAEDANRAKSDFLATMSHEIRTPMNGVLGFTQLLLDSELSPDQRDNAQLIFNSAEALLALLNDILDFSKIEAGKLVIDPRPTAIVEAAREAVGLLKASAERKGIALRFSAEPQVPVGLLVDAMRFRQVLLNLTGNAVKFTPSGSVDVSLAVEPAPAGRFLVVRVKDSGIGISASVLPNLFGKFVQADTSTSRRFGGTGLGLAISKRLVELMGGSIGAESEAGLGSTFWFKVPIAEAVVEGARRDDATAGRAASARHRRVLLAEDNVVNQVLARKVLEKMNAQVDVAGNGLEAVRLAKAEAYDVILMDCQMPEMDGFEASRAVRSHEASLPTRSHVPIIAVTANAFADDIERCLASGMDAVLTKPFKLKDLERTLEQLDAPQPSLNAG